METTSIPNHLLNLYDILEDNSWNGNRGKPCQQRKSGPSTAIPVLSEEAIGVQQSMEAPQN